MQIERADLDEAAARQIVDATQAASLWLPGRAAPGPGRVSTASTSRISSEPWLVIGAMGWLMTARLPTSDPGRFS
jgi:hypothetical protein